MTRFTKQDSALWLLSLLHTEQFPYFMLLLDFAYLIFCVLFILICEQITGSVDVMDYGIVFYLFCVIAVFLSYTFTNITQIKFILIASLDRNCFTQFGPPPWLRNCQLVGQPLLRWWLLIHESAPCDWYALSLPFLFSVLLCIPHPPSA